MAWISFDSTTLCVIFLIITLSALWMYVSLRNEGTQQPNFSLLHEVTQKTTAGHPKGQKTKGKRKMVDGSPRPSHTTASKGVLKRSSTGVPKGKAIGPSETSGEDEQTVAKSQERKKQSGQHVAVKGKQVEQSKHKPSVSPPKSSGGVSSEEGATSNEEGEWQTQLSRPQLKALRQKQRQKEKKEKKEKTGATGQVPSGVKPSTTVVAEGAGASQLEEASPPVSHPAATGEEGEKKKKKNKKRAPPSSSSEEKTASSSDDRVVEESTLDSGGSPAPVSVPTPERAASSSPELHVTSSVPVEEVETALVEAARPTVSSVEEVEEDTATTMTDTATKKSKRRKKSRKQVKPANVSPEPVKQQNLLPAGQDKDLASQPDEQQAKKEALPVQEQQTELKTETETVPAKQEATEVEVEDDQEEWVFISKDAI